MTMKNFEDRFSQEIGFVLDAIECAYGQTQQWPKVRQVVLKRLNGIFEQLKEALVRASEKEVNHGNK